MINWIFNIMVKLRCFGIIGLIIHIILRYSGNKSVWECWKILAELLVWGSFFIYLEFFQRAVFCKKIALKNFPKICNLIKKDSNQMFSCQFSKFFRNTFIIKHFRWLLLSVLCSCKIASCQASTYSLQEASSQLKLNLVKWLRL